MTGLNAAILSILHFLQLNSTNAVKTFVENPIVILFRDKNGCKSTFSTSTNITVFKKHVNIYIYQQKDFVINCIFPTEELNYRIH